jgi:hypothetical protein
MPDLQFLFDLIGGARRLTLYALLAPIPIVVIVFVVELVAAQRRSSNGGGVQRLLITVDALHRRRKDLGGIVIDLRDQLRSVRPLHLRRSTDWAFDAAYMLYGTLFMMASAYALSATRVRGDFIYRATAVPAGRHGPRAHFLLLPAMLAHLPATAASSPP